MEGKKALRVITVILAVLLPSGSAANPLSAIVGTVIDAQSGQPIAEVVVTMTSSEEEGERIAVTRPDGSYRLPNLRPGDYVLRFEREHFEPYVLTALTVREGRSLRVNVTLQPSNERDILSLDSLPPTVDTESSALRDGFWRDGVSHIPVSRPSGWDGAVRTADSLAEWVPGTVDSADGLSISGASPFENEYLLDGLSTRDPLTGRNLLPLSRELLGDVEVLTGGYMPEYGRTTGGILDVKTPAPTLELRGEVFANWAPGVLEGTRMHTPEAPTRGSLEHLGDIGGTLSGSLHNKRLWFFAGVVPTLSRVERNGAFVDQRNLQALGRLTYAVDERHHVSLSVLTAPASIRSEDARAPWHTDSDSFMARLDYNGWLLNRRLGLDIKVGWLSHRATSVNGEEDSATDLLRIQGKAQVSSWLNLLGVHLLKAGVEFEEHSLVSGMTGTVLGSFAQDRWTPFHGLTLNGGIRYDVQLLETEAGGEMSHHQLSPRLGLVLDPSRNGRVKVFAHAAKYQGLLPLGLLGPDTHLTPRLAPTSSSELVAGAEHELGLFAKAGVTYTHRRLDDALAVVPQETGEGFSVVNPQAERTYDALAVELSRRFSDGWQAQVSYIWSRLHGNYAGPFGDETGRPLAQSRLLPADRPHVIKAYGSKAFLMARTVTLNVGLAYLGAAGTPRDTDDSRTPWVHTVDVHLSARFGAPRDDVLTVSLDAFNLLNSQVALRDDSLLVPLRYQTPRQLRLGLRYAF
ncbi:TonB-dependent receptor [Myxococcus sp. Y35]|uniref:TonB-dependent receptor n=1 Tax=Pseudomyxococcus flavus TaxID=3115648 RepID=UPI003CECB0DE